MLRGSRLITDTEARFGAGGSIEAKREDKRWEDYLTRLSEQYSLASRTMALVAVVERAGDRPGEPPKTHVVPVGLPKDMRFAGVFSVDQSTLLARIGFSSPPCPQGSLLSFLHDAGSKRCITGGDSLQESRELELTVRSLLSAEREAMAGKTSSFDALLELSIQMQPDGSMPGKTGKDRILATLLSLLAFLAEGHTAHSGPFRIHVGRMLDYLDKVLPESLSPEEVTAARLVIRAVRTEKIVHGDWLALSGEVLEGKKDAGSRGWKALVECGA